MMNDCILNIEVLCDELESTRCVVNKEDKFMYILGGLDETFDNVFSILTENAY